MRSGVRTQAPRSSEQSCTRVPDERLGVSRIGLEHRAPLHRTRYESGAEAMTSEGRGVEAETGRNVNAKMLAKLE